MPAIKIAAPFNSTSPTTQGFGLGLPAPEALVFQPSGTAGFNVYTSIGTLLQAAQSMLGDVLIVVAENIVLTSETLDFGTAGHVTITGYGGNTLELNGCTISPVPAKLTIGDVHIDVEGAGDLITSANNAILELTESASITSVSGAGSFWNQTNNQLTCVASGTASLSTASTTTLIRSTGTPGFVQALFLDAVQIGAGCFDASNALASLVIASDAVTMDPSYAGSGGTGASMVDAGVTWSAAITDPQALQVNALVGARILDTATGRTWQLGPTGWQGTLPQVAFSGSDTATSFSNPAVLANFVRPLAAKTIYVAGSQTPPAGSWDLGEGVSFAGPGLLDFSAGTTMPTASFPLSIVDTHINVSQVGQDVFSGFTGGVNLTIGGAAVMNASSSGSSFANIPSGAELQIVQEGQATVGLASATVPVFTNAAGGTLIVDAFDGAQLFDASYGGTPELRPHVETVFVAPSLYADVIVLTRCTFNAASLATTPNGTINGQTGATLLDESGTAWFHTSLWVAVSEEIVFQPGGTASPGVFTDWTLMLAYVDAAPGPMVTWCDFSHNGDTFSPPAGSFLLNQDWWILRGLVNPTTFNFVTLSFDNGTTFNKRPYVIDNMQMQVTQAGDVITSASGVQEQVYVTGGSQLNSNGGAGALFTAAGTSSEPQIFLKDQALIAATGAATITGAASIFVYDSAGVQNGSVSGTIQILPYSNGAFIDGGLVAFVDVTSGICWAPPSGAPTNPNGFVNANGGGAMYAVPGGAYGAALWIAQLSGNHSWNAYVPQDAYIIDFPLSALKALGAAVSTTINMVTSLGAGSRAVQPEITVAQAFAGPGLTGVTLTMQGNTDAPGTLVTNASGLTAGSYGLGSNPYPSRAGQSITVDVTLTGGTTFAALTAGHLQARVVVETMGT